MPAPGALAVDRVLPADAGVGRGSGPEEFVRALDEAVLDLSDEAVRTRQKSGE